MNLTSLFYHTTLIFLNCKLYGLRIFNSYFEFCLFLFLLVFTMLYINSLCILIHIVCIFIICSISAILIINPLLISYNLSYTKLVHFVLIFYRRFLFKKMYRYIFNQHDKLFNVYLYFKCKKATPYYKEWLS